jgi:hypothetical protein
MFLDKNNMLRQAATYRKSKLRVRLAAPESTGYFYCISTAKGTAYF